MAAAVLAALLGCTAEVVPPPAADIPSPTDATAGDTATSETDSASGPTGPLDAKQLLLRLPRRLGPWHGQPAAAIRVGRANLYEVYNGSFVHHWGGDCQSLVYDLMDTLHGLAASDAVGADRDYGVPGGPAAMRLEVLQLRHVSDLERLTEAHVRLNECLRTHDTGTHPRLRRVRGASIAGGDAWVEVYCADPSTCAPHVDVAIQTLRQPATAAERRASIDPFAGAPLGETMPDVDGDRIIVPLTSPDGHQASFALTVSDPTPLAKLPAGTNCGNRPLPDEYIAWQVETVGTFIRPAVDGEVWHEQAAWGYWFGGATYDDAPEPTFQMHTNTLGDAYTCGAQVTLVPGIPVNEPAVGWFAHKAVWVNPIDADESAAPPLEEMRDTAEGLRSAPFSVLNGDCGAVTSTTTQLVAVPHPDTSAPPTCVISRQ